MQVVQEALKALPHIVAFFFECALATCDFLPPFCSFTPFRAPPNLVHLDP